MCCRVCIVLMQFVFPFLVFFVLLFAGTFNTEPLLVLGRGREDPDAGPGDRNGTRVRCVSTPNRKRINLQVRTGEGTRFEEEEEEERRSANTERSCF